MDLKELNSGIDPHVHWYYQSKKIPMLRAFRRLLSRDPAPWTCLDVGAGSGFFSETLAADFPTAVREVIQVDNAYRESELEPYSARAAAPAAPAATAAAAVPFRRARELPERIERSFVLLMDVLEHLEDDASLLRDLRARSRGSNVFFITVPAFASLWSHHDEVLGHHRRYTRTSLLRLLDSAGFATGRAYYVYGLIFPLVWARRRLRRTAVVPGRSDLAPVHPLLNAALRDVNRLEMRMLSCNRLCGLTCVAEGTFRNP